MKDVIFSKFWLHVPSARIFLNCPKQHWKIKENNNNNSSFFLAVDSPIPGTFWPLLFAALGSLLSSTRSCICAQYSSYPGRWNHLEPWVKIVRILLKTEMRVFLSPWYNSASSLASPVGTPNCISITAKEPLSITGKSTVKGKPKTDMVFARVRSTLN